MSAPIREPRPAPSGEDRPRSLVWIDAREAVVVRRLDGDVTVEHLESEVPVHRKSTGHVRHDTSVRHGGGIAPQTAGEPHRLEHLNHFVRDVAVRVAPDDDLTILGSGTVPHRLARYLRREDAHHRRTRMITVEGAPRLTDRQLVARVHHEAGVEPRRPTQPPPYRPNGRPELSEAEAIAEAIEAEA